MVYVLIEQLPKLLKTNNPSDLVNEALTKVKPKKVFLSETDALSYVEQELKIMTLELRSTYSFGLVELEVDKENFISIQQNPEKLKKATKALIIKGKKLDARYIEIEEHEKQQLQEMHYQEMKPQDMLLKEPYPCFMLKIPSELRFLCFIDYALFHHYFENWIAYNMRELYSVLNLFNTQAKICKTIFSTQAPEPLSLDYICKLQASLSQNLLQAQSGTLRTGYNAFPIIGDAITVKGAFELLQRIKNDKNENGFMVGEVKHFEIAHQFSARNCLFYHAIYI